MAYYTGFKASSVKNLAVTQDGISKTPNESYLRL